MNWEKQSWQNGGQCHWGSEYNLQRLVKKHISPSIENSQDNIQEVFN